MQRLSGLDAGFGSMETPTSFLHVASVMGWTHRQRLPTPDPERVPLVDGLETDLGAPDQQLA